MRPTEWTLRKRKYIALLVGLLRSPKTKAGLMAAAESRGITKNFVHGWLSEAVASGRVLPLKSHHPVAYQCASFVVHERPAGGEFPVWLEPRSLPTSLGTQTYVDGKLVRKQEE